MRESVSALILTGNDEANVGKCIKSLKPLTRNIYVVDAGSTDRTREICRKWGAVVAERSWTTYAEQVNWGLSYFDFPSQWIMRIDPDEEVTAELAQSLTDFLEAPPEGVSGVCVRKRVYFLGRWIKHGGCHPRWSLRVFRKDVGRSDLHQVDGHIVLDHGKTVRLPADIVQRSNSNLTVWTEQQNISAAREALASIENCDGTDRLGGTTEGRVFGTQDQQRRWLRINVYDRCPLLLRAFVYFVYCYVVRLGFLDGREGLIFHFLAGFWYRFLVDAKISASQQQAFRSSVGKTNGAQIVQFPLKQG